MPSVCLSKISKPTPPPCGTPRPASAMRVSYTRAASTSTVVPPSPIRYGIFSAFRYSTTAAPSEPLKFESSTRYCGRATQTPRSPVPRMTPTVSARNVIRRAGGSAMRKSRICSVSAPSRFIAQPLRREGRTSSRRPSHLDAHDLLVGVDDLVPHLHHQAERHVGLLHGDHRLVEAHLVAGRERGDRRVRFLLQRIHLVERALQHLGERMRRAAGRGCRRLARSDERDL